MVWAEPPTGEAESPTLGGVRWRDGWGEAGGAEPAQKLDIGEEAMVAAGSHAVLVVYGLNDGRVNNAGGQ